MSGVVLRTGRLLASGRVLRTVHFFLGVLGVLGVLARHHPRAAALRLSSELPCTSHAYAQAGGRWIVRPLGNVTTSGSWHFAGRSRRMFL